MKKGFFTAKVIEPYFLERENPYTKRRLLNMRALSRAGIAVIFIFVLSVLFFGKESKTNTESAKLEYPISPSLVSGAIIAGSINANPEIQTRPTLNPGMSFPTYGRGGGGYSSRNRNANQVIRRGEGGTDPGARLPMGYGIPAKLLNAVLSSDSGSPVVAEVTQDVFPPSYGSTVSIPVSARAIGSASYDSSSQRIQVRFHTLVYPDGTQHGIQGIGLKADGSAGLQGDYRSGETKRQTGRFLGYFVGGLAEGMKEKQVGGQARITFEPGSVRNGVLNGISEAASDQAKSFSDGLGQTKPTMSLTAGETFIIFLEHEFIP